MAVPSRGAVPMMVLQGPDDSRGAMDRSRHFRDGFLPENSGRTGGDPAFTALGLRHASRREWLGVQAARANIASGVFPKSVATI